jgi:hypothetical protein
MPSVRGNHRAGWPTRSGQGSLGTATLPRREVKDRTRDDEEQRKWKVGGELPDQESPPPSVTSKVVPLNWLRGTPGISILRAVRVCDRHP